jgi:hypothetical protein
LRHWQLLDLVASQFEGALAPDALLGVVREGGEAIDLLEDTQVKPSTLNVLKTTEKTRSVRDTFTQKTPSKMLRSKPRSVLLKPPAVSTGPFIV